MVNQPHREHPSGHWPIKILARESGAARDSFSIDGHTKSDLLGQKFWHKKTLKAINFLKYYFDNVDNY